MTNLAARTTHDLPAALPSNIPSIETALLTPAQGIQCGSLNVAFSFAWARSIVEDFSLTPIPNAPAWLLGAANIEGEIVPVFDLVSWVGAGASGCRATPQVQVERGCWSAGTETSARRSSFQVRRAWSATLPARKRGQPVLPFRHV
jgi:hypothetical protein